MIVKYKPARNFLQTIFHVEILQGMALTLRRMFSKPITRQYPLEKVPVANGFRGLHALVRDLETGKSKCIGCLRCVAVCPSLCIHIDQHRDGNHTVVDSYEIDALRCVYCGYCEEVCPVNALVLTEVFEYSDYNREAFYFDEDNLLTNWDRFVKECDIDEQEYVNPFWRPRGMPEDKLTAAKRLPVPDDWTIEGQFVGRKYKEN